MFLPRFIMTIILNVLLISCVLFSNGFIGYLIPVLLCLGGLFGANEFLGMSPVRMSRGMRVIVVATGFIYLGGLFILLRKGQSFWLFEDICLFTIVFTGFCFFILKKPDLSDSDHVVTENLTSLLKAFVYVFWSLGFCQKILFAPEFDGRIMVLFLFLVSKSTDIFAYITGKLWGKNKLIPEISPNKTIEGAVGGICGAMIIAWLFWAFSLNSVFTKGEIAFISLSLPVISILGDLAESLLKRDSGIKDSGSIIPGMGGMLDLLDSILFTGPYLYFVIKIILNSRI